MKLHLYKAPPFLIGEREFLNTILSQALMADMLAKTEVDIVTERDQQQQEQQELQKQREEQELQLKEANTIRTTRKKSDASLKLCIDSTASPLSPKSTSRPISLSPSGSFTGPSLSPQSPSTGALLVDLNSAPPDDHSLAFDSLARPAFVRPKAAQHRKKTAITVPQSANTADKIATAVNSDIPRPGIGEEKEHASIYDPEFRGVRTEENPNGRIKFLV
jgi:hypothetical protein